MRCFVRLAFRALVLALVAVLLVGSLAREARAEESAAPGTTIDLYTIGPSGDFPSRFGHSLLCARPAGKDKPESGRCFDYGVADSEDITQIGWTAIRGKPSFIPVVNAELEVLAFFRDQGRQIERQRLPLTDEQANKLVAAIDEEIRDRRAYAYHPYFANCSTKIRDHIDAASGGRLREGPSSLPRRGFRDYMEEGETGRIGILTVMALFLGEGNDRVATPWEAMLIPSVLRDGVAERFSVPPERLDERLAVILPTSVAIGRVTVFFLAVVLFVAFRLAARRGRFRLGLMIVGGSLGALALSLELTAALVTWPEVAHNWALLVFLPTDLALPYLTGRRLALYLKARMALAGVFVVLEVVGIVHQPMLPLVALVVLPMAGILSALRDRDRAASEKPAAQAAPAGSSS